MSHLVLLTLEPWLSNLVSRKVSLGRLIIPHNGHWCSKLLLVKSIHLVRNAHEEVLQFLNIKPARDPEGGAGVALKTFR